MHAKNKGHGGKNPPWSGPVGEENGPTYSIYIPGRVRELHHSFGFFYSIGCFLVRVINSKLIPVPLYHPVSVTYAYLTTYCLHIGHSAICLPHCVQVHMCPHSSITQSIWTKNIWWDAAEPNPSAYRRVHADFAQWFVIHSLYITLVPLLLLPQSLHNLQ